MRIAMISMHTSPLQQPGSGDAGGMNVYVLSTATELARQGTKVDIYTRATRPSQGEVVEVEPNLRVINMRALIRKNCRHSWRRLRAGCWCMHAATT